MIDTHTFQTSGLNAGDRCRFREAGSEAVCGRGRGAAPHTPGALVHVPDPENPHTLPVFDGTLEEAAEHLEPGTYQAAAYRAFPSGEEVAVTLTVTDGGASIKEKAQ